jgi:hypothetical protein
MSGDSGEASAVVTRNYLESGSTCDSCAQAVRLLLNFGECKQKGRSASGPTTEPMRTQNGLSR